MKIVLHYILLPIYIIFSCNFINSCYATLIEQPNQHLININSLRIWPSPANIRVVFELNKQPEYKIYNLTNPDRVVVDFTNAKLNSKLALDLHKAPRHSSIKKIRTGIHDNIVRVVFELDDPVLPNSFTLKPNESYGYRLVIDLESNEKQQILALFDLDELEKIKTDKQIAKPSQPHLPKTIPIISPQPSNQLIVAIDAGHGGEDPGAIGPRGTFEKDIVLSIARILKDEINDSKNMRAFLIRNGDYYVGLKERMLRARQHKADLFISIHADAFSNARADGASVFVLSEKGESSAAAKWLADSQNKSDTIGGVKIEDKNDILASVLLNLSQTANAAASIDAAKNILLSMKKTVPLHKSDVEQANFAVLRSLDVPSVLIETGFISNPRTELKLRDKIYQRKISKSIINGIKYYFASQPKRIN